MLVVMSQNNQPFVEVTGSFAEARFAHFLQGEESVFESVVCDGEAFDPHKTGRVNTHHQWLQAGF